MVVVVVVVVVVEERGIIDEDVVFFSARLGWLLYMEKRLDGMFDYNGQ